MALDMEGRRLEDQRSDNFDQACGDLYSDESLSPADAEAIRSAVWQSIGNLFDSRHFPSEPQHLEQLTETLVAKRIRMTPEEARRQIGGGLEALDIGTLPTIDSCKTWFINGDRSWLVSKLESLLSAVRLDSRDILPGYWTARSLIVEESHESSLRPRQTDCMGYEMSQEIPDMKFDTDTGELFMWNNLGYGLPLRTAAFGYDEGGASVREFIQARHTFSQEPEYVEASRHETRPGYELVKTIKQWGARTEFNLRISSPAEGGRVERHYETAFDEHGNAVGRSFKFERYGEDDQATTLLESFDISLANDKLKLAMTTSGGGSATDEIKREFNV